MHDRDAGPEGGGDHSRINSKPTQNQPEINQKPIRNPPETNPKPTRNQFRIIRGSGIGIHDRDAGPEGGGADRVADPHRHHRRLPVIFVLSNYRAFFCKKFVIVFFDSTYLIEQNACLMTLLYGKTYQIE